MASLILQDGTVFTGQSFGAKVDSDGEVVFSTGMVGYPESLTDPSFRGQILTFTYPLIGNYGVPSEELNEWGFSKYLESEHIHVRGIIVAEYSETYSHHAAKQSLGEWMEKHRVPGITGIDTRALTKKLREHGVMLGRIVQDSKESQASEEIRIEDPNLRNLVAEVSCKQPITYEPDQTPLAGHSSAERRLDPITVVAFDCGMKRNIIRSFLKRGVRVIRVPWDFDLSSYDGTYDGVFISNGPGDPKMCISTIRQITWAIGKNIPTWGICLGNQLVALAIGGDTYKLKYGHRGLNQPCLEQQQAISDKLTTQSSKLKATCIITSQNHGFAVQETLPPGWHVWFTNANDGTVEGIRHESGRFSSIQFHPEATPGPEDATYLFDGFVELLHTSRV
jgi:carbamoyl-phosphate synthase small subunit